MPILYQFINFAGVGAIGTTVHYTALFLLISEFSVDPIAASTVGFALGAITNYFLNYRYIFRSTKQHNTTLPRFMAVACVGLALNSGFMALFIEILALHYLLAQVLSTGLVLIWNFSINKIWTF